MDVNPLGNQPFNITPLDRVKDVNTKQLGAIDKSIKSSYSEDLMKMTTPSIFDSFKDNRVAFKEYKVDLNDAYVPLSSGEYIPRFENYLYGVNNEERLARQQSSTEKWLNGFEKLSLKTGTAILGGTAGVVSSLITGIKEGSLSAAYNDNFNNWLDDLNTKLDYRLPNYYTEEEKNKSFGEQLGTANFWADKVFGGLSFTLGAIGSEAIWAYATGGMSLLASEGILARAGRWGSKALSKGEQLAGLSKYKQLISKPILDATINGSIKATNIAKALDTTRFLITSSGYEAGVEARHFLKQTEEDWRNNFIAREGRNPNASEEAEFKDKLTTAGNWVFGANMAIVGAENFMTIGKLFRGKSIRPEINTNSLNRTVFGIGYEQEANGALKAIEATGKQKLAGRLYGVLKVGASEGIFEEGMQGVASKTANGYVLSAYDPEKLKEGYGVIDSIGEGFKQAYGTKEGLEEVGIGVLVGLIGGAGTSAMAGEGLFNEKGAEREQLKKSVDYYNEFHAGNLVELQKTFARVANASQKSDIAKAKGDLFGEIHADREAILAVIDRQYGLLNLDNAKEQYTASLNTIDNKEFAKELGISEQEVEKWKESKISEFNNLSESYERNARYAQAILGSEQIKEIKDKEQVSRAIAYTLTMGEHAQQDERNFTDTIAKLVAEEFGEEKFSNTIKTDLILDKVSNEITTEYNNLNKALKTLVKRRDALTTQTLNVNKTTREQNKDKAQKVFSTQEQLLETEKQIQEIQQKKQALVETINLKNGSNAIVTTDTLDNQTNNLKTLEKALDSLKETNPQKHALIQKIATAQHSAIQATKSYDKLAREINDPNNRVTVVRGMLSKILKARQGKEEHTYFADSLEYYISANKADTFVEQAKQAEQQKPDVEILTSVDSSPKVDDIERSRQEVYNNQYNNLVAGKILDNQGNPVYEEDKGIGANGLSTLTDKKYGHGHIRTSGLNSLKVLEDLLDGSEFSGMFGQIGQEEYSTWESGKFIIVSNNINPTKNGKVNLGEIEVILNAGLSPFAQELADKYPTVVFKDFNGKQYNAKYDTKLTKTGQIKIPQSILDQYKKDKDFQKLLDQLESQNIIQKEC